MSKLTSANYPIYQGAGNDFLIVDDRTSFFPTADSALIRTLCESRDVDGLLLLQNDPLAPFRMRIFNRDGSEAESCGNGLRCLLRFLLDLGLPRKKYQIAIGDRIVEGDFVGDRIAIAMGAPQNLRLRQQIEGIEIHSVDTGVPHAVLFVSHLKEVKVEEQGRFLRDHPYFQPRGTNVNFAELQKDGSIAVRTYERGVEGETLACGTGAAAVACIGHALFKGQNPIRIHCRGGDLEISISDSGQIQMIGPAIRVSKQDTSVF